MRWLLLAVLVGCVGGADETDVEGDSDTDADSDADTDADTDVDEEPIIDLEGVWLVPYGIVGPEGYDPDADNLGYYAWATEQLEIHEGILCGDMRVAEGYTLASDSALTHHVYFHGDDCETGERVTAVVDEPRGSWAFLGNADGTDSIYAAGDDTWTVSDLGGYLKLEAALSGCWACRLYQADAHAWPD